MRKVLYIFGLLTDADVEWMARVGARRRLQDKEVVIREGERNDLVVILLEGRFAISTERLGEIDRVGTGEIVGEVSLVDSAPASATVTAMGECVALFLDQKTLSQKLDTDPGFGRRFYRALAIFLADRLRERRRLPSSLERGIGDQTNIVQDELDPAILDTVSAAGERFHRMLHAFSGREP